MEAVKIERDIEKFLQKVEIQLDERFKSYEAPGQRLTKLDMLSRANYSEIIEKGEKNEIPYPWDFYQALAILPLVEQARIQLSQNDCQGLTYSVGLIIQTIASGGKIAKKRTGRASTINNNATRERLTRQRSGRWHSNGYGLFTVVGRRVWPMTNPDILKLWSDVDRP